MRKIELEIAALSHTVSQSQSYAVVLGEISGVRRLPVVIGGFEAQAIAVAIENIRPSRPLTHDLFKNVFSLLKIELKEIIIDNLQDGIFYSKLICSSDGQEMEIDSRTSDALALAVRFDCPIYTYEFILESAGIILEDSDTEQKENVIREVKAEAEAEPEAQQESRKSASDLSRLTIKELKSRLEDLLEKEEYEKAVQLRDELKRRGRDS